MHFIFPSDPFDSKRPDDAYAEEFDALRLLGMQCLLFSYEEFEAGRFTVRPGVTHGAMLVYRGWMLTPSMYQRLADCVAMAGAQLRTSPRQYQTCHYLPGWYASCREFTPETRFLPRDADFAAEFADVDWPGYFVKDYVKSLTTGRGSVAYSSQEISGIVDLLERFRGQVEGGVCVRKFEPLIASTEERYFVIGGRCFSREGAAPQLVEQIAARIDSPFFSVDLVQAENGDLRLIELGDGQVSDRKNWPVARFVDALSSACSGTARP